MILNDVQKKYKEFVENNFITLDHANEKAFESEMYWKEYDVEILQNLNRLGLITDVVYLTDPKEFDCFTKDIELTDEGKKIFGFLLS